MKEQRRSQRIKHELLVELHERRGPRQLYAVDVARHGLFLATNDPPRERHLVQLTVHLPDGPIRAAGSVTRTIKDSNDHEDGVGIQFFALSDEAKDRWDAFIFLLQRTTPPRGVPRFAEKSPIPETSDMRRRRPPITQTGDPVNDPPVGRSSGGAGATFLVKLKSVERLREFQQTHLAAGGTVLFTPVLRDAGEGVTLIVVHPRTDEEFRLPSVIHKAHSDRPKRLEIHFHGITPALLNSFAAFVETGHPPTFQLEAPPQAPPTTPKPPDKELDLDVDVFDEDTLDTDERIWSVNNKLPVPPEEQLTEPPALAANLTAPPATTPPTTTTTTTAAQATAAQAAAAQQPIPLDPGLKPRAYLLRCDGDGCASEAYAVDLGPCRGVLGLVADHCAFISSRTGKVVTTPRLASAEDRQSRTRHFLEGGGRLDASVDVMTLLGAVALVEPAKDADGPLKHTRAVERLEQAARRMTESGKPAKTKVACPVCKDGHLMVELAAT